MGRRLKNILALPPPTPPSPRSPPLPSRFDITEISAPYARELLLEARPQFAKWADDLKRRAANQNRAVVNLFKGPNQIEEIGSVINRLESGDLKLRVRALEAERALTRVQVGGEVSSFCWFAPY